MQKPGFSSYELKIIKRVFLFSVGISLAVVAGAWLYNNQKIATIKKISFINEQKTLNELDITAHQITAARYLQNGNPRKAIPHLQRILIYNNKDQLNHINLAHAFLEAGISERTMIFIPELIWRTSREYFIPLSVPEKELLFITWAEG